jgi:hypothetical protein
MKHLILFIYILSQLVHAQENNLEKRLIDHFFIEANSGLEKVFYSKQINPNPQIYENYTYLFILGDLGLTYRNRYLSGGIATNLTLITDARVKVGFNMSFNNKHYIGPFYQYGFYVKTLFTPTKIRDSHNIGLECYLHGIHVEIGYIFYVNETDYIHTINVKGQYFKLGYAFRLGILKKK